MVQMQSAIERSEHTTNRESCDADARRGEGLRREAPDPKRAEQKTATDNKSYVQLTYSQKATRATSGKNPQKTSFTKTINYVVVLQ